MEYINGSTKIIFEQKGDRVSIVEYWLNSKSKWIKQGVVFVPNEIWSHLTPRAADGASAPMTGEEFLHKMDEAIARNEESPRR